MNEYIPIIQTFINISILSLLYIIIFSIFLSLNTNNLLIIQIISIIVVFICIAIFL